MLVTRTRGSWMEGTDESTEHGHSPSQSKSRLFPKVRSKGIESSLNKLFGKIMVWGNQRPEGLGRASKAFLLGLETGMVKHFHPKSKRPKWMIFKFSANGQIAPKVLQME